MGSAQRPSVGIFAWADEKWDGTESVYASIKKEIESKILEGGAIKLKADVSNYKQLALAHKSDPKAQFYWGYAALRSNQLDATQMFESEALNRAFEKPPSPHSYEYARLRFIIQATAFSAPWLQTLGSRLLERDPRDYQVMYSMLRTMDVVDAAERQRALAYLDILLAVEPKVAKYFSINGAFRYALFLQSHDEADKKRAIEDYEGFLKLAQADDPFRARATSIVEGIKSSK